ncbi:MAG: hypothetical protein HKN68_06355 [Saprospiraceae bacterium]|nr:hypothetical protein [Saprospiraceae bacterium]
MKEIIEFVRPFYDDKDIMHDLSHIERIKYKLDELAEKVDIPFNKEVTEIALYFHGIIYSHESLIKDLLQDLKYDPETIEWIVKVAWESQKESKPSTNEGLILHDAHMLEGGRNFEIIKSLITGSVRGQTLDKTMDYIENNLLNEGQCYTDEGIRQYAFMKARTKEIFDEMCKDIGR